MRIGLTQYPFHSTLECQALFSTTFTSPNFNYIDYDKYTPTSIGLPNPVNSPEYTSGGKNYWTKLHDDIITNS